MTNKIKKTLWKILAPFLPFIILIVVVIFLVSYFIDGIFVQVSQNDNSYLSQEELEIKDKCIQKANWLNKCDNYIDSNKTEELLDADNREESKKIQWSHLYTLLMLEDSDASIDDRLEQIGSGLKSTFIYKTSKIQIQEKVTNENGEEEWKNVKEETKYILVSSNTIYGKYEYQYKEEIQEREGIRTIQENFVQEQLIGEKYGPLKQFLIDYMKIKDEEIEEIVEIVINSSTGYYEQEDEKINFSLDGQFLWPIPGYTKITSNYGYRIHPISGKYKLHSGVDVGAPIGANFVAMADGIVCMATYSDSYGNMVIIKHNEEYSSLYAHGSQLLVKTNQYVTKGTPVLKVGSTGNSTGPHAHFEIRKNNQCVNPMDFFYAQ